MPAGRTPGVRQRRRTVRRRGRDRGGTPIELAILWPAILLLVFGAVQVATYFTARTVALSAAQVGVATARQYDATDADGKQQAEDFLAQAGDWLLDWEVEDPVRDETAGTVSVTVHGTALTLIPGYSWPVQQTAHGTIERFTLP